MEDCLLRRRGSINIIKTIVGRLGATCAIKSLYNLQSFMRLVDYQTGLFEGVLIRSNPYCYTYGLHRRDQLDPLNAVLLNDARPSRLS